MSDAPHNIWIPLHADLSILRIKDDNDEELHYVLATPAALSDHPTVKALVAEAVAAERERCVAIAVRHWDGEPEDTIAMAAEMRVGMTPLSDYQKKVAQMREDFPNGV